MEEDGRRACHNSSGRQPPSPAHAEERHECLQVGHQPLQDHGGHLPEQAEGRAGHRNLLQGQNFSHQLCVSRNYQTFLKKEKEFHLHLNSFITDLEYNTLFLISISQCSR